MKRRLYKELIKWKNEKKRKPLLLQGARQVGKTYLINQFGKNEYEQFHYINFEENPDFIDLFEGDLSPDKLIERLSLYIGKKIDSEKTLLFFDEIQIAPRALTSLKYFHEKERRFHVIAAGSLLGVSVGKTSSFPVGKVNFLNLYPLSFTEYLRAFNEGLLADKIESMQSVEPLPNAVHDKLMLHLKKYLFLGGMPEVLQNYLENKDIVQVRQIQNEILNSYKRDFSKYTNTNQSIKISEIWESVPYQLAKENKKFKYADVRKNARASHYQQTIEWLKNAGLIYPTYNISIPKLPLSAYSDRSKFKIYMLDCGLLGAMLKISARMILRPNALFSEYNGAFIENFVAGELTALHSEALFYWTSRSDAEVDFIIQKDDKIYPAEVKSGLNRNLKSLKSYADKYHPEQLFRLSPRNFTQNNNFINLPLYAVQMLK